MRLIKHIVRPFFLFLVAIVNFVEGALAGSRHAYKILLVPGFERLRWGLGVWRAWGNFYRAYDWVPAYRTYIDQHGGKPEIQLEDGVLPVLTPIPEMDKESYVKKFGQEERLVGGKMPGHGVMVDESSGSSGVPTSWVRGKRERMIIKHMMQLTFERLSDGDTKPVFILNAFALGAWATGMNVAISLTDTTILKSTGPNLDKIIGTIKEFGPGFHYCVMGYPPFLKTMADDPRLDWAAYTIDAGFGGEGVSESLRDYLQQKFKRVMGSYGASDLEVNMALESQLTINLRKALLSDDALRKAILRDYGVTPMIFQYNPLAYHLEENDKGELVCTISRPYNISPKIRYNIHDRGHVVRYGELKRILEATGHSDILGKSGRVLDLPLLFIYGRSDMTIEYYGAKVTPDSLREILFGLPDLAPVLNTFRLISYEDAKHNKRMQVAVELRDGATYAGSHDNLANAVFEKLAALNGDFLNAWKRTATAENMPELTMHAFNTGPFEGGQQRLKNTYVATSTVYDKL